VLTRLTLPPFGGIEVRWIRVVGLELFVYDVLDFASAPPSRSAPVFATLHLLRAWHRNADIFACSGDEVPRFALLPLGTAVRGVPVLDITVLLHISVLPSVAAFCLCDAIHLLALINTARHNVGPFCRSGRPAAINIQPSHTS
jgi:hypothetical protein